MILRRRSIREDGLAILASSVCRAGRSPPDNERMRYLTQIPKRFSLKTGSCGLINQLKVVFLREKSERSATIRLGSRPLIAA